MLKISGFESEKRMCVCGGCECGRDVHSIYHGIEVNLRDV
jgi:hypothetical protein